MSDGAILSIGKVGAKPKDEVAKGKGQARLWPNVTQFPNSYKNPDSIF